MTESLLTRADAVVAGDSIQYRGRWYVVDGVTLGRLDAVLDVTPYDQRDARRRLVLRRRELVDVTHTPA